MKKMPQHVSAQVHSLVYQQHTSVKNYLTDTTQTTKSDGCCTGSPAVASDGLGMGTEQVYQSERGKNLWSEEWWRRRRRVVACGVKG